MMSPNSNINAFSDLYRERSEEQFGEMRRVLIEKIINLTKIGIYTGDIKPQSEVIKEKRPTLFKY